MANPQHIEWLLEGVESWNARREREDFTPDFEGADLREIFRKAGALTRFSFIPLVGADLRMANLGGTILRTAELDRADLGGADLGGADLRVAYLGGAILRSAKLGGADLRRAQLGGADLRGADVQSVGYSAAGTKVGGATQYTDLSTAYGLLQEQIDGVLGDSGTILPEGLERPAHWPELDIEGESNPNKVTEPDPPTTTEPFVFVIVPEKEPRAAEISDILKSQGLTVWQDRTIDSGLYSRGYVRPQFTASACVLVLWTETSATSDAVREEAARAQSGSKLVHARLDDAPLPYGFAETQYVDLTAWDGTADHPAMQRLIQSIRAKLGLPPSLPDRPAPREVIETDGQLGLGEIALPDRSELEVIHADLRDDLLALHVSGSFDNISKVFDTAFSRFVRICNSAYAELDQVRFGVQAAALRRRFDSQRAEITEVAPEKIGDLEAVLLSADLLAARLPVWREFLAETQDEFAAVEANQEEIDKALEEASDAMKADPAHYDPPLAARLREYWDTKTTEAYLAGIALINDAAFLVAREVQRFSKNTLTESRKIAVKGMAAALIGALAGTLAKLAGIVPAELQWVLPWLEYIPTVLK